jgi:autoinducer 2-degrading protein
MSTDGAGSGEPAGQVVLSGHLQVPADDLERVRAALPEHRDLSRAEPGCLEFRVEPHPDDPCRFDVFERFVDRAAFQTHQERVRASAWGRASATATRHYTVRD